MCHRSAHNCHSHAKRWPILSLLFLFLFKKKLVFDIWPGPHLYLAQDQSLHVANFQEYYCLWSLKKIMWGIFLKFFFFIEEILMCISLKENLRIKYNPSMAGGEDSSSLIQILLCYINHLCRGMIWGRSPKCMESWSNEPNTMNL